MGLRREHADFLTRKERGMVAEAAGGRRVAQWSQDPPHARPRRCAVSRDQRPTPLSTPVWEGRGLWRSRPFVTSAPMEERLHRRPRPEQVRRRLEGLEPRGAGCRVGPLRGWAVGAELTRGAASCRERGAGRREPQARRDPLGDPVRPPAQRCLVARFWRPLAPHAAGLGT